jgi:hypothetical protein
MQVVEIQALGLLVVLVFQLAVEAVQQQQQEQ